MKLAFDIGVEATPPKDTFLDDVREKLKYTTDMPLLERHEFMRVFVCDEMQSTCNVEQHDLLDAGFKLAVGTTAEKFLLFKQNLGLATTGVPIEKTPGKEFHPWGSRSIRRNLENMRPIPAVIRGEMWAIRSYDFPRLDTAFKNGYNFYRRRVKVHVANRRITWAGSDPSKAESLLSIYRMQRAITKDTSKRLSLEHKIAKIAAPAQTQTPMVQLDPTLIYDTHLAWMYIGNPDYWENQLNVEPARLFVPKKPQYPPYYQFTRMELRDFK